MTLFKISSFVFLGLFGWVSEAKATAESCRFHYFANLHFSHVAFSKNVNTVYAHVGALTELPNENTYGWSNVQHIELHPSRNGFAGKTEIVGHSFLNHIYNHGVVIQYWVSFEDGTRLITDSIRVDQSEVYNLSGTSLNFDKILDVQRMRSNESEVYETNVVTIFKCFAR